MVLLENVFDILRKANNDCDFGRTAELLCILSLSSAILQHDVGERCNRAMDGEFAPVASCYENIQERIQIEVHSSHNGTIGIAFVQYAG